jgi:hypothetical protein
MVQDQQSEMPFESEFTVAVNGVFRTQSTWDRDRFTSNAKKFGGELTKRREEKVTGNEGEEERNDNSVLLAVVIKL